MPTEIKVYPDLEALNAAVAELIIASVATALESRPRASLALSGGSTPRRLYAELGHHPYRERIDWNRLHVFLVDERFVPPDDEESNQRMIRETLLSTSPLPERNFHPMPFIPNAPERAAHDYESELKSFFSLDSAPQLDILLLGMGPDGHTASLFPGTAAVNIHDRWVAPTVNPAGPSQRLTLTLPVLNRARTAAFMITGADKAETLREVIEERPAVLPAAHVELESGDLHWLVDSAAGSRLSNASRS